jgi:hypothetical protein
MYMLILNFTYPLDVFAYPRLNTTGVDEAEKWHFINKILVSYIVTALGTCCSESLFQHPNLNHLSH